MNTNITSALANGHGQAPQTKDRPTATAAPSAFHDGPINILIVDDEPKNLTVLETVLDDPAYRLVRAESADQALLALVVEEFALLILDIRMPGMTGFELAQMIKDRKKTARVPIIFLTAYFNEDQHVLEGYGTGAVDYLHKPVNPAILRSKVAVFAELHRKTRESVLANRALLAEVTERRRAEERLHALNETLEQQVTERTASLELAYTALNETSERYRSLFDGSLDAILSLSADGRVEVANPTAQRLIGHTLEELKTIHFLDLCAREHRKAAENAFHAAFCLQCLTLDTTVITATGHRLDLFISGAPAIVNGKVVGVSCIARDVTARNQAEAAIRDREERLRLATDVAELGIWTWEPVEDHVVWENDRQYEIFGVVRTDEPITAAHFKAEFIHPEDLVAFEQAIENTVQAGTRFFFQSRFCRPDGELRWIEFTGKPVRGVEGPPHRVLGITRDITAPKRAENELKAANLNAEQAKAVAEAANKAKDHFLAVLSHELRTPLTPVLLAVTAGVDDEQVIPIRPTLEMIRRNIELEAHLIDDLLDITRISRGMLQLDTERVDVHDLLCQVVENFQAAAGAAGLTLTLDLAAGAHYTEADPMRLRQVFWNLIQNAIKFTPAGGSVSVRTRNKAEAPGEPPGAGLVVEVADTGIGIEPELLLVIFNPFERGDVSSQKGYGGLGLGLAISLAVAEAHGGRLTAWSAGQGKGTTFSLELTTASTPATAATPANPPPAAAPTSRSLRLLLVEDNADTLRNLAVILSHRGHTVRAAPTLGAARQLAAEEEFDLLICDIELPDGTGLELMRELGRARAMRGIALSGYGSAEDLRMSWSAGFAEHLTKPVDIRALEDAIRRVSQMSG